MSAMKDVFATMEEPEEPPEAVDLTARGPCANIFSCCFPKSSDAATKDDIDDEGVAVEKAREFDLPDLDEEDSKVNKSELPNNQNIVVAFWQLLMTIVFFNWMEEKGPKKILPAPSPSNVTDVSDVPEIATETE